MTAPPLLLAIVELGGYPNFTPLYRDGGYAVEVVGAMRKALSIIKKNKPAVVVAEFNYQPDFRERVSNLEPLLATLQRFPDTRVMVFYEPAQAAALHKLQARFPFFQALAYPIEAEKLREFIKPASASAR